MIVCADLTQEQADQDPEYYADADGSYVDVLLARWHVAEGTATAVWPLFDKDEPPAIMGLGAWPHLDKEAQVRFGE